MVALLIHLGAMLVIPPFMVGLITVTKSWLAGRRGPSPLQPYRELYRLLRKGTVFSETTTWLFQASPVVGVASLIVAGLLLPFGFQSSILSFGGDLVLFVYLLGLARFFTGIDRTGDIIFGHCFLAWHVYCLFSNIYGCCGLKNRSDKL
jgi:formate hydrogenlyase subunit 4